jgi:hypothetical protein
MHLPTAGPEGVHVLEEYCARVDMGQAVPYCECTWSGGDDYANPLCQSESGGYDQTQRSAGAYPSLRQLQVLYDSGDNSSVASICPKTIDEGASDFGYRPAVDALLTRLSPLLRLEP